jgi:hypothetical protein
MPNTRLILHVKGTEAETAELSKDVVRAAISQGQITHSQLIWSPGDNAWKQVRELPDLLPSQKLAPSASRAAAVPVSTAKAVDAMISESPASPVARVAAAASAPSQVRVASGKAPTVQAVTPAPTRFTGNLTVKEAEEPQPLKWVCIGLGIFILLVLGANYLLVDRPLVSNLGQTAYSNVKVYAHYGAFMQPTVMVIHIPASTAITRDNLTDFMVTLAHSTPQNAITGDLFDRVALTSGWTTQYSFSGEGWKQLGRLKHGDENETDRKEFLLGQMRNSVGQSLMLESTANEEAQQARRNEVWETFAARFTAKR